MNTAFILWYATLKIFFLFQVHYLSYFTAFVHQKYLWLKGNFLSENFFYRFHNTRNLSTYPSRPFWQKSVLSLTALTDLCQKFCDIWKVYCILFSSAKHLQLKTEFRLNYYFCFIICVLRTFIHQFPFTIQKSNENLLWISTYKKRSRRLVDIKSNLFIVLQYDFWYFNHLIFLYGFQLN